MHRQKFGKTKPMISDQIFGP